MKRNLREWARHPQILIGFVSNIFISYGYVSHRNHRQKPTWGRTPGRSVERGCVIAHGY